MHARSVLTYGFVPISFPRDPVEFNQFDEHVAFGQIVESLVEADENGQIVPAISNEWRFSKSGEEIVFQIDKNKKFSNGLFVKPEDVVYSIKRHISLFSQSNYFLNDIKDIITTGPHEVTLILKRNNPFILKALTRDQLGILPAGWVFDKDSTIPYIGTGPYVLRKNNNDWYFEANPFYNQSLISINTWKLIFYKDSNLSIPSEIPSVTPYITKGAIEQINKLYPDFLDQKSNEPIISFMQTSFWIHPKGNLIKNAENRIYVQHALDKVIDDFCKSEGLARATGFIPKGIQGYLEKQLLTDSCEKIIQPLKLKNCFVGRWFCQIIFRRKSKKNIY